MSTKQLPAQKKLAPQKKQQQQQQQPQEKLQPPQPQQQQQPPPPQQEQTQQHQLQEKQQPPLPQQQQQQQLDQHQLNPIGKLQELSQKRFWPLPAYSFEGSHLDRPAERKFHCTVRLLEHSAQAAGLSKRQAKREAALYLLQRLLTSTPNPSPVQTPQHSPMATAACADGPAAALSESNFQRLRASKRLQSAARAGTEVDGLFRGVLNRKAGAPLPAIEAPTAESAAAAGRSPSDQLLELGKAHRFCVLFLPQDDRLRNRCVLKLCTMPTIVVVANGATPKESREQACLTALEYLCVLTRENTGAAAPAAAAAKK